MGKPVLFLNFHGSPLYNVVSGPLQFSGQNFEEFRGRVQQVLEGSVSLHDVNVGYYISEGSDQSPLLVARGIKQEWEFACHSFPS